MRENTERLKEISNEMFDEETALIQLSPYTMLVTVIFDNAVDKLHAMSEMDGMNRMRVGNCSDDDVEYWIHRTGADAYTLGYKPAEFAIYKRKKEIHKYDFFMDGIELSDDVYSVRFDHPQCSVSDESDIHQNSGYMATSQLTKNECGNTTPIRVGSVMIVEVSDLSAQRIVELVGEHNILAHEMFEEPTKRA